MDAQRYAIKGQVLAAEDTRLQEALAAIHDTPERPRCLCIPGGVEMYVARHRQFVVKRMPGTGCLHHPTCSSYEPEGSLSGLGELLGEAVLEPAPGHIELRVDFPWSRMTGRAVPRGELELPAEVTRPRQHMSLRAVTHFLFERAGFNRWAPAMEGRRNQAVLRKYLLEAAGEIVVKRVPLAERLYVPEQFHEGAKLEAARRRREKLSLLWGRDGDNPLALLIGEYKTCEPTSYGHRLWVRHMPDAPLLMASKTWERMQRVFAPILEARDADTCSPCRILLSALIRARREHTYEIDSASLMLASEQWIPVDGVHELPLLQALVVQQRRFVKPLRYDARSASHFPNVLLLDAGPVPVPLHVLSAFVDPKERAIKEKVIAASVPPGWVWRPDESMPAFPSLAPAR
ncbi:DUF1173 family protein [Cupriavidus basilensis]|uniref:DUF1173 family protein n=1 Tax=Cupriavidus basilensis TaxID=68895 RepID=A0ABT6AH83_9BURK|nr:DUF1173 family protein [Cupriavidus basilensis]MDF3831966.1 DUF1173 family protein [Cupriavidus basilensis]